MRVQPAIRVRGRAVTEDGTPLAQVVLLFRAESRTVPFGNYDPSAEARVTTHDDGRFELHQLPSGRYDVELFRQLRDHDVIRADELGMWGRTAFVAAGRDVDDLVVTLKPGVAVAGTVVFDVTRPLRALGGLRLLGLEGTSGGNLAFKTPGDFRIAGVRPGKYLARLGGMETGVMVSSITLEGRDVMDKFIDVPEGGLDDVEIRVTDRMTRVSGSVTTVDGRPAPGAAVVIFPVDPRERGTLEGFPFRMKNVQVDHQSGWQISGLPPGDYYVAAIDDERIARWSDDAVLSRLVQAATRLTVTEGTSQQVALRVVPR